VYGPESEAIVYTYKNIGICYLALGVADKAEENYLNALNLMNLVKMEDASQDEELLKDDREQLATIYFNLYLSSISNDDKEKARVYNLKALEYNKLVHGVNSIQVSNGQFI
jgi:tetratricopeptide (TPR) repeat protein